MHTSNNNSFQGAGGVGGLLASTRFNANSQLSTIHFYHYDGNGNVTELTDASGATVASYRYTAFGKLRSSSGSAAEENEYRFSTKPYDEISQCYYYGYRFYNPEMGRWLNRDPIGEDGGLNLYAMIGNDSVNQWDVLGMCWSWARALSHYVSRGGDVTLEKTGCNSKVTSTLKPKFSKYMDDVVNDVAGSDDDCCDDQPETETGSGAVSGHSGVWWIGGVYITARLKRGHFEMF